MNAFIEGFLDIYPDLTSEDRFLQTYDLTSDAAFTGYLIPLLLGATVYTIPPGSFKYLSIVKILQEQQITWTQFTPSVLNYLRPYLKSIRLLSLKHSHFGGEALPFDLVSEWAKCVPNCRNLEHLRTYRDDNHLHHPPNRNRSASGKSLQ